MLHILSIINDNIIVSKATGKLAKKDINKIHPLIQMILAKGLKVRWYFEMQDFNVYEFNLLLEDLKGDVMYANDYERIAIVGEKKWKNWLTQSMKYFTKAEIEYFNINQKKEAKIWIESQ